MKSGIERISEETLQQITKSLQTSGFFAQSGIQGVDLSGLVSLVPVNVPARNNTSAFPRTKAPQGALKAQWRALLNVNSSQSDAAVGWDDAGSMVDFEEQDVYAPYQPLAKSGRVTLDQIAVAEGFADVLAVAELQVLNILFTMQDIHMINGQSWALSTPATPTLSDAATGGSIASGTAVYVKVAARSGNNYYINAGNTAASTAANITVGTTSSTNSVTASVPAVQGAVAYDWYVGTSASQFYYTTTTVAQVTITAVPTAAQPIPTTLQLLSTTAPASTPPTANTSNSVNWYNGVMAANLGDYGAAGMVTPGTGTSSQVTFIDWGGNAPTASGASIDVLDTICDKLWTNSQLSPTAFMVNSQQGDEITKLALGSTGATTFLPPTDADARTNLAGGGYIGRYINHAAAGVPVVIEVHPHVAPGTIIARTDRVPFPGSNIGSTHEVRCLIDTMRFNYASALVENTQGGGPRYDFEVRSIETLVARAPSAQAVVSNIG